MIAPWTVLILGYVVTWRTAARLAQTEIGLRAFAEALSGLETAVRSGATDVRAAAGHCGPRVARLMDAARRQGQAVTPTVVLLRRRIGRALDLQSEARRLWRMYQGRAAVAFLGAMVGRTGLMLSGPREALHLLRVEDAVALVVGLVLASLAHIALAKVLPSSWLWQGRLTVAAERWMQAHLWARAVIKGPIAAELRRLEREEAMTGVSLRLERRRRLSVWAGSEHASDRAHLRKCVDWLPLLELAGIGLPAVLVLLVPTVVFVQQYA